jgi:hypothetical protein
MFNRLRHKWYISRRKKAVANKEWDKAKKYDSKAFNLYSSKAQDGIANVEYDEFNPRAKESSAALDAVNADIKEIIPTYYAYDENGEATGLRNENLEHTEN